MDPKQEGELDTQQEVSEEKKSRLLEIYKLHAQLASAISNRRDATYRFYPTLISGLLIILFTVLQHKNNIFSETTEGTPNPLIGYSMLIAGCLGMLLSLIWKYSINRYNLMLTEKYKVLMELETKLEFHFFQQEWKSIEKKVEFNPNVQFSTAETYISRAFLFLFIMLSIFGFLFSLKRAVYLLKPVFN